MKLDRPLAILVVDDEPAKRKAIADCIAKAIQPLPDFSEAASFESATRILKERSFDWVILDMRITTYDVSPSDRGGRPRNLGGDEVLRRMARRGMKAKVVVVTQYSIFRDRNRVLTTNQLVERLRARYSGFVGLVELRHKSDAWEEDLIAYILAGQEMVDVPHN